MLPFTVVGAGVIGLSTAIRLQEAGWEVRIVARDLPEHTVSAVAAAIWFPFIAAPQDKVNAWSKASYEVFEALASQPETGVFMTDFLVLMDHEEQAHWKAALPEDRYRPARPDELPAGPYAGYMTRVPLSDTSVYLPYLRARFEANGGRIEQRSVSSLEALTSTSNFVINCSGLGARALAHDESVYPVRGQILRIPKQAGIQSLAYDADIKRLTYIVERSHDIILGGTAYANIDNTQPDPADTTAIRDRTTAMQPQLAGAPILETKVGLRPARPFIRLEREAGTNIIHNYGHGGSGYTVSWGCAGEVLNLLQN